MPRFSVSSHTMPYTGRFAPTPSGRLHLGSIVAATGAYLRAKSLNGRILLRIEDLDTPRCPLGMGKIIEHELKTLGFHFDETTLVQSDHKERYQRPLQILKQRGYTFNCACTRADLKLRPCTCEQNPPNRESPCSIRFKSPVPVPNFFEDELLGKVYLNDPYPYLTLQRTDGIISYNLACVWDDALEEVTEVVRGSDLIYVTIRQMVLSQALGFKPPKFLHLPLAMASETLKLSKQNHAKAALDQAEPAVILLSVLRFLGQDLSGLNEHMRPERILDLAASRFSLDTIPHEGGVCSLS